MACAAKRENTSSFAPLFKWLMLLAFLIAGFLFFNNLISFENFKRRVEKGLYTTAQDHGEVNHGEDAKRADQCFDNFGASQTWFNRFNQHYIQTCFEPNEEQVYLRVFKWVDGQLLRITRYPKVGVHTIEQITQILKGQGAWLE